MTRSVIAHAEVIAGNARVHWLIEVEIGGYVYRAADDDLLVTDANGATWRYVAGVDPKFKLVLRANGSSSASVSLSADVQGTAGGWPSVITAPPHGSPAKIRRWMEGQLLEEARVLLDGEIFDATFDGSDDPFSFSVRWLSQTPIAVPPQQARISTETWPLTSTYTPDQSVLGAAYPLVFGTPGFRDDLPWGATVKAAYCTPAYLAQHSGGAAVYSGSRLAIGWIPDGSDYHASTVTVFLAHDDTTSCNGRGYAVQSLAVTSTTDLLGYKVAVVAPGAYTGKNTTVVFKPDAKYYLRWNGGGGVLNEDRTGPMRKAGEIIQALLRWAGLKVDAGRMTAARGRLDRYLLDFALTESNADIRRFIASDIGAIVPLAQRVSPDGMWFEALNYFPAPYEAVLHLVVSSKVDEASGYREADVVTSAPRVLVFRASGVAYTNDPIMNTVVFRYAPDQGREPTQEIVVTGAIAPDAARNEIGSVVCATSRSRWQERVGDPVESRLVHDYATGAQIAIETAARAAWPRRLVSFSGDVADLEVLEPADVVRVTDVERGIDGALGLVMEIEYSLTTIVPGLELLDHLGLISPVLPEEQSYAVAYPGASVIFTAFDITGTTITSLRDLSGNGYHATSVTGSAPTWTASHAKFGGRPAIACSGGDIATTQTFTNGDMTVVVAFADDGTIVNEESPAGLYYTDNMWLGRKTTLANTWVVGIIEPGSPFGQTITVTDGSPAVVVITRRGTTHNVWVNGTLAATKTGSSSTTGARAFRVGGGLGGGNFSGAVGFAGLWSRALSDDEIRSLSSRVWRGALGQHGSLP